MLKANKNITYDAIIIGAGPAGITAAVYAARKGMKIAVISKNIGGQVTKTSIIENYTGYQEISGLELVEKFNNHLKEFNFEFIQDEVKEINENKNNFIISLKSNKLKSKTIIISTGARSKKLNVPGENKFKNKGVTYCATCDAPLFHNKDVAVIGGGNSALESGVQLSTIAKKVYMINNSKSFSGDKILIDKLSKNKKVEIIYNAQTEEIRGGRFVEFLKFKQNNRIKQINIQGVFIEIGFKPNSKLVQSLVSLNSKNEIEIDSHGKTSKKGIFSAGDCTNIPYKQIVIASGAGAIAAISTFNYLSKEK